MPDPTNNYLVHLCSKEDWQAAQAAGEYRAASLEKEGFIHCSRPEQILGVANRFYRGMPGLLLWLDPSRLRAELRNPPIRFSLFVFFTNTISSQENIENRETRVERRHNHPRGPG